MHPAARVAAALAALAAVTAAGQNLRRAPAPALHFLFDDVRDGRVTDASGHGNNGRLEGSDGRLPSVVDTPYGPALRLSDGHGHGIRIDPAPGLAGSDGLTVMAWVKPERTRAHLAVVACKGDRVAGRAATGYRLSIFWSRAFMELGFGGEDGVRLSSPEWSVHPHVWAHLAMTFDGRDMILYINAAEAARHTLPEPRTIVPFNRNFTVGKFFWNDAYPFTGLLADVRIYPQPLSEDQILDAATRFLHRHD